MTRLVFERISPAVYSTGTRPGFSTPKIGKKKKERRFHVLLTSRNLAHCAYSSRYGVRRHMQLPRHYCGGQKPGELVGAGRDDREPCTLANSGQNEEQ